MLGIAAKTVLFFIVISISSCASKQSIKRSSDHKSVINSAAENLPTHAQAVVTLDFEFLSISQLADIFSKENSNKGLPIIETDNFAKYQVISDVKFIQMPAHLVISELAKKADLDLQIIKDSYFLSRKKEIKTNPQIVWPSQKPSTDHCFEVRLNKTRLCRRLYSETIAGKTKEIEIYYLRYSQAQTLGHDIPILSFEPPEALNISDGVIFSDKNQYIAITRREKLRSRKKSQSIGNSQIWIFKVSDLYDTDRLPIPKLVINDPLAKNINQFDEHGNGTYTLKSKANGCLLICPIDVEGLYCEKSFSLE